MDNPNNPTGQVITLEQTEKIVSLARELDSFVVMDEAYGDYMEMSQSAAHLIDKYDNLAVMRTFSKGMGAAGIRLGYILAQPGVIGAAAKVNVPFSKNEVADYVARSLLSSGWTESCVKKIVEDKPKVLKALSKIKAAHTSNSVPITMLYVEDTEVDLCQLLEQAGIRAITGVGYDGIGKNTVRLNLHSDVQRLIACLLKAEEMLSR